MVFSNSLPVVVGFKQSVAIEVGTVLGSLWKTESLLQLSLNKVGGAPESFVIVLFVDGSVMLAGVFAALHHERDQREKLRVGVSGVVRMGRGL